MDKHIETFGSNPLNKVWVFLVVFTIGFGCLYIYDSVTSDEIIKDTPVYSNSVSQRSDIQAEVSKDIYYKNGKAYVPINVTWQEVTQCFNMYKQVWEDCK